MDYEKAIEAIKKNFPPESYTMLREALDLAIESLKKVPVYEKELDRLYTARYREHEKTEGEKLIDKLNYMKIELEIPWLKTIRKSKTK